MMVLQQTFYLDIVLHAHRGSLSLSLSLEQYFCIYHHQATLGLTTLSHSVEHALIIVFSIIYTPPSTME